LIRCRVQFAWWQDRLAGYSALCANSRSEGQLARLAVHPDLQGRGIGRALVTDAIAYAGGEYRTLVLNTQTHNTRSQALYRRLGFRAVGTPMPVLARLVERAA
jgi:ribosomal-protein-alanine N-acetyltransferase